MVPATLQQNRTHNCICHYISILEIHRALSVSLNLVCAALVAIIMAVFIFKKNPNRLVCMVEVTLNYGTGTEIDLDLDLDLDICREREREISCQKCSVDQFSLF